MADNRNPDLIHVDEGTLHAWLDGALATNGANVVRTHIAECEACAAAAAEGRGLIAASSRILSALDGVPADVVPVTEGETGGPISRQHSAWSARRYASVAAVLVFAAVGALVLRHDSQGVYGNFGERSSPAPVAAAPQAEPHTTAAPAPALDSQVRESRPSVRVAAKAKPVARDRVPAAAPDSSRANGLAARELASNVAATEARVAPAPVDVPVVAGARSDISDSVAITGRVTATETGLPLPNASVFIAGLSAGATTDSAGFFSIGNVPPGSHTIIARRVGYAAARQLVNIGAGRPVTLALALPAAGSSLEQVVTADAATNKQVEFLNASPAIVGTRQISTAVSTEGGHRIRRTVYAVGSGAQITLTEKSPRTLDTTEAALLRAPALSLSAATRGASLTQSIEWVAADGTTLVLSGAFPAAELEAFKARIVR